MARPANWNLSRSRGGRGLASRSQISISVTLGPGATCQGFLTGCISQRIASGGAMVASVVSSPAAAIAQAVTASRAVLVTRSRPKRSSCAPASRIVSATNAPTSRLAASTKRADSDRLNAHSCDTAKDDIPRHFFVAVPAGWPIDSGRRPACPAWLPYQLPGSQFAERVGDLPLPLVGRVQVDQRGACAAVAHPRHQLS